MMQLKEFELNGLLMCLAADVSDLLRLERALVSLNEHNMPAFTEILRNIIHDKISTDWGFTK